MDNKPKDAINPQHYNGRLCIEVMLAIFGRKLVMGFCLCNVFKYLWRHAEKNGREDIEKAVWYFDEFKDLACKEYMR